MTAVEMAQQELFCSAADWRLIGLLFECPTPGWADQVEALAATSEDPMLRDAGEAALTEATEGVYHSIFGPGGPASPREATYAETVQLGHVVSELSAYYNAFAFEPNSSEVPDHVATEAGFVSYLQLKKAFAIANNDVEKAALSGKAAERFIEEHLALIVGPLSRTLKGVAPRYLDCAAQAVVRRVPTIPPARPPSAAEHFGSLFNCSEG